MKHNLFFAVMIVLSFTIYGQNVGIGTSSPNALLDVYSNADGILIPRVSLTGTGSASPLSSPTTSTMVYNTATAGSGATAVSPGFYYWSGSTWVRFIDNASLTGSTTVGNTSSGNTLSTTVNGVTGSTVPLINTNAVSQNGSGQIISTINGIGSTPYTIGIAGDVTGNLGASTVGKIQGTPISISSLADGNLLQYNASGTNWANVTPASVLGAATTNTLSLSTNTLTSTVNGVAATSAAVSAVSNTSSVNTLSTTVNGVTSSTVPIINSNVISQNGSNQLISTINGIGSTPYTVALAGDVTGNLGTSTVTKIQGQSVSATAPSSGQVLEYSGGTWSPTTPGSSLFTAGTGLTWSGSTLNSVWATSGNNIYNTNSGYVGIGTSTPGYTLDLNNGTFGFGASNVRTEVRLDAGLQGSAGAQSGFFQNDGSTVTDYPSGASGWWHMIDCRHSNGSNNYAMQFAGSFFDQNLYFRKTDNNPAQAWSRVMTSTDVSGTTNYISKFTSANTIGNSVITDDGNTVVFNPPTYTYFQTGTVYAQNELIARGSIYNDGGSLTLNGSNSVVNASGGYLQVGSGYALQGTDSWLRLNNSSSFSSGTYTPGFLRADGGIASGGVGSLGSGTIIATSTIEGNGYVDYSSGQQVIDAGGGWHRSYGNTGWYNGTYGIGLYATDGTWVRTYNNASFWAGSGNICTGGKIGAGTSAPAYPLDVVGNMHASSNLYLDGGTIYATSRTNYYLALQSDRNLVLYDGGVAKWASGTSTSDIRTKDHIIPLEEMLPTIMKLSTIRFNYKKELDMGDEQHIGVIAQEINKYFPDMVYHDQKSDRYLVYYDKLVTILIKGMQEQQKKIEELAEEQKKNLALEQQNCDMRYDIDKLKASVETLQQIIGTKAER